MPILLLVLIIFFYLGILIYIKRNKNTLMQKTIWQSLMIFLRMYLHFSVWV